MSPHISRRNFLRAAGVSLVLPWLEGLAPAAPAKPPRRMVCVCTPLGLHPAFFFPEKAGKDYALTPYLEVLKDFRDDFTVISGLSHPDVGPSHDSIYSYLTAAPHPELRAGFRNTISLDQFMAERIGHLTRVPSLNLGVNTDRGNGSVSWTSTGVMIPAEQKGSEVFKRLFVQGTPEEAAAQIRKLELGQSILDSVADQANDLRRTLGPRDRGRLDQYLTSVRELEQRMAMAREWEKKPKPAIIAKAPTDPGSPRLYMEKVRMMYDLARLAFETDATRLVTILLDSVNSPAMHIEGVEITDGYHNLSHHGRSQAKLAQLKAIDGWHMKLLDELFTNLKAVSEDGDTLLDRSMILYGTNLGNAQTHVTTNLPTVFAGGGFRHGQHLAFDTYRNYPLANLFVSMLQRMGIEIDRFSTGIATMRGLEMV
jgi:hypothetical protein